MEFNKLKEYYNQEVEIFKTPAAKKSFLTRSKKEVLNYIKDLKEALKNPRPFLYGDPVHGGHLEAAKREIEVIESIYKTL